MPKNTERPMPDKFVAAKCPPDAPNMKPKDPTSSHWSRLNMHGRMLGPILQLRKSSCQTKKGGSNA